MTEIPESHPRYRSLRTREALVEGVDAGLVAPEGLIAHGRGEALDYLLGETSIPPAEAATQVAAAHLILAEHPVVSVNGNTAVLAAEAIATLQEASGAAVEVNLFHRTPERVDALASYLEERGVTDVLGREADGRIPGLDHARSLCSAQGIEAADVVLVPLEDGDRCQALRSMGKTVIVVDLNPLSRTARSGSVPIVDELTRAVPNLTRHVENMGDHPESELRELVAGFDASANLGAVLEHIVHRLRALEDEGWTG